MPALHGVPRRIEASGVRGGRSRCGGKRGVPWYCRPGFLILTFVTVPPFAIPLVWLHQKLHIVWKLVITAVIGLMCWCAYPTFVTFTQQFEEATKMMKGMPF